MLTFKDLFFKLLEEKCRSAHSNWLMHGRVVPYEEFRIEWLEKFIANAEDFEEMDHDPSDE